MNAKILIVDDEPAGAATLEAILESEGYQLEFAQNGEVALEKALQLLPDVILLDVMMPGIDGFEVCRRMRATPALAEAPILILTALDDYNSRITGLEAGADDFFNKPLDRHELRARLRTITRLNRYRTLMNQREKLREMAGRMVETQEQERRRISREIHDDFGQSLTAHILKLQNLNNDIPLSAETLRVRLNDLLADSAETLGKMRLMAQDLRPPILDTLELRAALENYCTGFSARAKIPLNFEGAENIPALSDAYAISLYRFLQETLTNITRHANASTIWVELSLEENELCLTVQDNGVGFDPAVKETQGIGIIGLQERMTLAGGDVRISSAPGRGTIISAHVPLAREVEKIKEGKL